MAFRLRKDAREKLFRPLLQPKRQVGLDFDIYYFCLMAGFATGYKKDVPQNEAVDLVQGFPGPYKEKGRLIVALFLKTELEYLGVDLRERTTVHDTLRRLVSPASPSYLSDEGEREINKYAHAGVDTIAEWFGQPPQTLEAFLPLYKRRLESALRGSA